MNNIIKLLLGISAATAAFTFSSCSDSEDNLTPSPAMPNYFEPAASDNSAEAQLRRDFYGRTGIYLLFNDTLAYYTDEYGVDRAETVDFSWNFTGDASREYSFEYIADENKADIAARIEKYFVPYINFEGGAMKPYSITLFDKISYYNSYQDKFNSLTFVNCWRSFGIATNDWVEIESEEEAKAMGKNLLRKFVDEKITIYSSEVEDFFDICYDLYYSYPAAEFPDWVDDQDITLVYEAGFLTYYPDTWDYDPEYDAFPTETSDLRLFKDAIFNEDEAEFREKWADYPIIILKYEILKNILTNLGIDFNAVK
ncbi:hypothetical protein [uncultured Muribaculum sp.]|uniref:hypothetical protein n=1 Tax=uncultured Muribaculum sp. TaxID=1918613 RepID=UPI0025949BCE|nr:hypothetical protein [uncultured Muribaculum sp.]